ncbi:hypothetical protein A2W48_02495 [Candidatus Giovannonibacteria bacterium RIFCSPHIGHO2_12_44_12]|uniref:Uncharacterized protein n=3 Tax=Candidatus Giovannoniibacteriota TaxID=1752738 RepID=A0A1F5WXQ5_9BACT|nr:MAG: hypothetical protein A2W57_02245 [Candidatus Giovannonibacteria bacterium RIFCSPHIGHO2_02_43_16]OGF80409.1 MAG: hypothetical protein A2W48_02495 [Candidatus Giovannonibacteria bacterium RIFCSPHIGHO2_12_44_12]OGF94645.1 MAG: hypothetical protein A2Y47_02355 [Candidatus Giovannonibacteria bacterium RIFCSPLOWO2_12_43_8]
MKIHGIKIEYDPIGHPFLKYAVKPDVGGKSFVDMLENPGSIALRGALSLFFVWLTYWLRPLFRPEKT